MKFFFVNTTKKWGGGEKWHLETACTMQKKHHQVTMLTRKNSDLFKKAVLIGLRTIPVNVSNLSFLNPFSLISLYRLMKKEKPDVIILNFSADIKTVGVAARLAGINRIIYRRGSAIPIRNTLVNRVLYKNVITSILANSEETKRTILNMNQDLFPVEKISVIYNGIDLCEFDNLPPFELYKKKKEEIVIGNVGRLVHQKGQKYLIDIALLLKKKNSAFKMLIAGDGPLEASLKQQTQKAGLEDQILFTGFISNIKAFMDSIDIFVLSSLWEGFGYVLIEAMACKKPVVAFNISSNPEIVADQQTGFLVDHFDIEDFAQKLAWLIQDPDLRAKFGQAGRERVEELFDQNKTQNSVERYLTMT